MPREVEPQNERFAARHESTSMPWQQDGPHNLRADHPEGRRYVIQPTGRPGAPRPPEGASHGWSAHVYPLDERGQPFWGEEIASNISKPEAMEQAQWHWNDPHGGWAPDDDDDDEEY